MSNEFQALVSSLGEHSVAYIGKDNLRSLEVVADSHDHTAEVAIQLAVDSWENREAAIDAMIDVRGMFLGEMAIGYHFVEKDETVRSTHEVDAYLFAS